MAESKSSESEVWMGGHKYRVAISYPEPKGTLEEAARIVAERYGLLPDDSAHPGVSAPRQGRET